MHEQQKNFVHSRNHEAERLKELSKRQHKIETERARLSKSKMNKAAGIKDVQNRLDANVYSECMATTLLADTVEELQRSGFFGETNQVLSSTIVPWLNDGVETHVQKTSLSRAVLDCKYIYVETQKDALLLHCSIGLGV